jgi:hypothetical protein
LKNKNDGSTSDLEEGEGDDAWSGISRPGDKSETDAEDENEDDDDDEDGGVLTPIPDFAGL